MLLLLLACSDTRTLSGKVVDIWGHPVEGATVVVEGVMERNYTASNGAFSIEVEQAATRVMVGKDGYIKDILEPTAKSEEEDYDPLAFELYPQPEKPGFYGVGRDKYVELGAQRIQLIGTDLQHYAGVQDIPEEHLPTGPVEFVFSTKLRPSEIAQMNLHLSKLEFIDKTRIKGVFGAQDATVQLWSAGDDVSFDLEQLASREDYVIRARGEMAPGIYAFHAHDVLHEEDERVLRSLPREQQVAFPFEVR
ncbi:MAG: carboxypeptidase regulatory-like domain-containing protein [Deltaproteobacteria bacterium]|nr:carboxypeptidase regulatory-like domain-containing protein [Deltaproteobacteria bacterium]